MSDHKQHPSLSVFKHRQSLSLDAKRDQARAARHRKGYRTARENLADLCDPESFIEYGQLAVAAQRERRSLDELRSETAADGIITGLATVNAGQFPGQDCKAAVIVNDYSVLAGTQGFFHHKKLDRILHVAREQQLPVIMYTEGGGGRPGDVDVAYRANIAGLDVMSFASWAALSGTAPRIAVNNGYCFAGNAALFGSADITVATRSSWLGMAGPAMIEGGGLGQFAPTDIGPAEEQFRAGVIDVLCDDEAQATAVARKLLGYFQGSCTDFAAADQTALRAALPLDRRYSYKIRELIALLVDSDSFTELRQAYGGAVVTGFARIKGRPVGLLASDCRVLGGAIDSAAAEKTARFMQLCDAYALPIISLCDTPGFMVGPSSEQEGAVRRMSRSFVAGASLSTPIIGIFLRKAYGLGAMALMGGSFAVPHFTAAWPSGEFGGMGLEGAVRLGFKNELQAAGSESEREALFNRLLNEAYEQGRAIEAASFLEIDAVIDPADTRDVVHRALAECSPACNKRMVDTW